jgi:hypothetical protein
MRYIRFVVAEQDLTSGFRKGVIHAAYDLADSGRLLPHEDQRFQHVRSWLNTNLPQPTRFARKRNASHTRTRGLSWFKDTARDHLHYMRELVGILEAHGIRTEMILAERPGYIVYEDGVQVVAEPFGDTGA